MKKELRKVLKPLLPSTIILLSFLIVLILFSPYADAAWIKVNTTRVLINTTYQERVTLVDAKLVNESGISFGLTTSPRYTPSRTFISIPVGRLPLGTYTFTIQVRDNAWNTRNDSEIFIIDIPIPPNCGDGVEDPDEECDDGNNESGDGCNPFCQEEKCGNSRIDAGEECDKTELNGQTCDTIGNFLPGVGTLKCSLLCEFDTSKCVGGVNYCGDGVVGPGEQCDGGVGSMTCVALNSAFTGGNLKCDKCLYNTSNCKGPTGGYCGDKIVTVGEQCDGGVGSVECSDINPVFTGGSLQCINCIYNTSKCTSPAAGYCGDGIIQAGEQCDGSLGGKDCTNFNFTGGDLQCHNCFYNTSKCSGPSGGYCGNKIIEKGEQCEGELHGKSCKDFDEFISGDLECNKCLYDTSDCTKPTPFCGDGILNGNEVCDEDDWGNITGCSDFEAFTGGALGCKENCHFDTTYCTSGSIIVNESCFDNTENGDESDVDCGGSCLCCDNDKKCIVDADCCSFYCKNNICTAPSCTDNIKNGLESGVDCGGDCPPCPEGEGCTKDSDCVTGFCNPSTNKCASPSCSDGYQNGDESDVDCGGGCPVRCDVGMKCISPTDCKSGYCDSGICSVDPTLDTDGDGMPDKWELKFGLNPNNPGDASEDMDGDGFSNLDEYLDGTDPTNPNDPLPQKKHTLQIILLIIGLLLMIGSGGFLVYSRKVLIPQQRAAAKKAMPQRPMAPGQPTPRGSARPPGLAGKRPLVRRPAPRQAARRTLLGKFGGEAQETETKKEAGPAVTKPGQKPTSTSEGFVPLSKLGKKPEATAKPEQGKETPKKPTSAAFEKLKELSETYKKKGAKKGENK